MKNKKFLIGTIVALILTFSFIFPNIVSAHSLKPGETPNVFPGTLFILPLSCVVTISIASLPVHDAFGNIYADACDAARDGIRVTWEGTH